MLGRFAYYQVLLGSFVFLTCMGLIGIYANSAIAAEENFSDSFFYLKRQAFFVIMGIFLSTFVATRSLRPLKGLSMYLLLANTCLLALLFVPGIGLSRGGATRWIGLGITQFQPGELLKITIPLYLASLLSNKENRARMLSLLPKLLMVGVPLILLLLQPDFGTSVLLALIVFLMLFVAGAQVSYLVGGGLAALPVVYHLISSSPYRMLRIQAFLDPWSHRQGSGYQIVQSLITMGSGKITGLGLGKGSSQLFFLPAGHTDFIYAGIGEEFGFLGTLSLILAFSLIAYCGLRISEQLQDPFEKYLAVGITVSLVLQAVINIFVVLGLFPTKGITLPFVSYGGSSFLISSFLAGVLCHLALKKEILSVNSRGYHARRNSSGRYRWPRISKFGGR